MERNCAVQRSGIGLIFLRKGVILLIFLRSGGHPPTLRGGSVRESWKVVNRGNFNARRRRDFFWICKRVLEGVSMFLATVTELECVWHLFPWVSDTLCNRIPLIYLVFLKILRNHGFSLIFLISGRHPPTLRGGSTRTTKSHLFLRI